jgi:Zn-dependent protease
VQLNIWLMAFNLLLPAYPLDGGRILVDLLLMCRVPVRPAAIVTVALAIIVAVLIMVWGFVKTAILTIAVSACHLASPVAHPAAHVPGTSAACSL